MANEKQNFYLSSSVLNEIDDYAIFALDSNGVIVTWNKGAEKIKGYTEAEIIGQHFSILYTEPDRLAGLPAKMLTTATENGKAFVEGWRLKKDGSLFWGSVLITPLYEQKKLVGYCEITRDLTEKNLLNCNWKNLMMSWLKN